MNVRMIAHDMRIPLNAIQLGVDSVKQLGTDLAAQAGVLDMMSRNIKTLSLLTESLLATSESGTWTRDALNFLDCSPRELVMSAMDQIAPLAATKRQRVESDEIGDQPTLKADGVRIIRVLVNLLSNAVKFTPEDGTIRVSAKARSNDGHPAIVFSVADSGRGVPQDALDQIFEAGVSLAGPGRYSSGLGLTVCKELVEAHGGRIWVEEKSEAGAVFSFAIPLASARGQQ